MNLRRRRRPLIAPPRPRRRDEVAVVWLVKETAPCCIRWAEEHENKVPLGFCDWDGGEPCLRRLQRDMRLGVR